MSTILAEDESVAEQHPVVVDLTQDFGKSSEKMVSTHISDQQDTMCEDILKELESKVRASMLAEEQHPPATPVTNCTPLRSECR